MYKFDCGIMVLKYLEHLELDKKYNGQSMPAYTGISSFCKEETNYLMYSCHK